MFKILKFMHIFILNSVVSPGASFAVHGSTMRKQHSSKYVATILALSCSLAFAQEAEQKVITEDPAPKKSIMRSGGMILQERNSAREFGYGSRNSWGGLNGSGMTELAKKLSDPKAVHAKELFQQLNSSIAGMRDQDANALDDLLNVDPYLFNKLNLQDVTAQGFVAVHEKTGAVLYADTKVNVTFDISLHCKDNSTRFSELPALPTLLSPTPLITLKWVNQPLFVKTYQVPHSVRLQIEAVIPASKGEDWWSYELVPIHHGRADGARRDFDNPYYNRKRHASPAERFNLFGEVGRTAKSIRDSIERACEQQTTEPEGSDEVEMEQLKKKALEVIDKFGVTPSGQSSSELAS